MGALSRPARVRGGHWRNIYRVSAVVAVGALALGGCSRGGDSASDVRPVTIRYALGQVKGTPVADAAEQFKKDLESQSDGHIKVDVYYSGDLGSNEDVMKQAHDGTVQMFTVDPSFLEPYYPSAQFTTLPFLFPDVQAAYDYWDGDTGTKEKDAILKNSGMRVLNAEEFGFHNLVNSKHPINTIDDVKGLKFEASDSPIDVKFYEALKIHPVTTSLSETYTALQQGVIDGIDLGFGSLLAQKQYEVAKYIAVTNDSYSTGLTMINDKFWGTLSSDDQKLITDEAAKIETSERTAQQKADADAEVTIKNAGGQVTDIPPDELQKFKDAMTGIYDDLGDLVGQDAVTWYDEYSSGS
jgi:TRAP-type transport system periplasmic protein